MKGICEVCGSAEELKFGIKSTCCSKECARTLATCESLGDVYSAIKCIR